MILTVEQVDALKPKFPILDDAIVSVQFESGRLACVVPFMFTWAILADLDFYGYNERWCYETLVDACGALRDWTGEGEPNGWHRHPNTGRRRDKEGVETILF